MSWQIPFWMVLALDLHDLGLQEKIQHRFIQSQTLRDSDTIIQLFVNVYMSKITESNLIDDYRTHHLVHKVRHHSHIPECLLADLYLGATLLHQKNPTFVMIHSNLQ